MKEIVQVGDIIEQLFGCVTDKHSIYTFDASHAGVMRHRSACRIGARGMWVHSTTLSSLGPRRSL